MQKNKETSSYNSNLSGESLVIIRNNKDKTTITKELPKQIKGKVTVRVEKKGRAGNPVFILSKFTDAEAKNNVSLKKLCSDLKNKLACGGTVEEGEIILLMRDLEKLKKCLLTFFEISII